MTIEYQGNAANYGMAPRRAGDIRYIVIHHSGTTSGNVEVFREYHVKTLGWGDIGYHYVITNGNGGPDGEVQPGRPELMTGAHAPGRNNDSVGICLVGDFNQGKPTAAQMLALYGLIKDLMRRYPITLDRILAHKEVNETDCPGSLDVAAIRAALKQPPAPPKPPEPKVVVNGVILPAIMVDGSVYAPVRALIEALNYRVDWDEATQSANIIPGGA